jgi:hypothetical protein
MCFYNVGREGTMPSKGKERALQIARSVLTEQTSILVAACELSALVRSNPTIASEDDGRFFVGIASETDHLPIGRVRQEWHPDFLPAKDREIEQCEALWREQMRAACERILFRGQQIQ